jgi:hypothetical protein
MKKAAGIALAVVGIFVGSSQLAFAETVIELKPFEQLEFRSGAMQSEDIRGYLQTMRDIMKRYTDCVFSVVMANGGAPPGPEAMAKASEQTQLLANQIAAVKAPSEAAAEHKQLATTLATVNKFLANSAGAGPSALPQALGLIGTVQSTLVNYRNVTQNLIHKYGLPQSLDPLLGDQNTSDKQRQLTDMMGSMKESLMMQNSAGAAGLGASGGASPFGALGGSDAASPFGSLGGSGAASPFGGGVFGNSNSLGGLSGFGSAGGMGALNSLGGLGGGSAGGSAGDTTGGALQGLDVNGLIKQMSDQNNAMQELLGE